MSMDVYNHDVALASQTNRDAAVERLAAWADSATAAYRVAEQLVQTSFVPEGFRGRPYEATAAILAGVEVGLSPMAALRSFDVINGQAAARAITLRAVAQSHGHEMEMVESTATRCKMRGRRRGATAWTDVVWTIDRARALNLTNRPNWKNQPQAMLMARATSELARLIAADAILGIGYSVEELADGAGAGVEVPAAITASAENESATSPGTRRMSRKKPAAPAEAEQPVDDAEVVDDADAPSAAQTKKAMALFAESGITDRDERLTATSAFLGREVGSWKELSKADASHVIEQLQAAADIGTPEGIDAATGEIAEGVA